jgi:hypothetical protein
LQSPHGIAPKFWHCPLSGLQASMVHLLLSESGQVLNIPKQMAPRQTSFSVHGPMASSQGIPSLARIGAQKPLWHAPQPPLPHGVSFGAGVP